MFPPRLPRYFIEQCTKPGDVVLDPFSGRGTTTLEAAVSGRVGIGNDLNPLAYLLTEAKVAPPDRDAVTARIAALSASYRRELAPRTAPPEIRMLFDGRRTLPQLEYVRGHLQRGDRVDRFVLAMLCGILHGNHARNPADSRSLSISMPNTFSMSPQYIKRYVRKNSLRKYPFDVFDQLLKRTKWMFRRAAPLVDGRAFNLDARQISTVVSPESVDLVFTSPPYLQVVRYGKYNWIRLWLLGESVTEVDNRLRVEATDQRLGLSDRLRLPAYLGFMEACTNELARVLRPGGRCVFVIGDVDSPAGGHVNLAAELWRHLRKSSTELRLVDLVDDEIDTSKKVTRIWGSTKGQATATDRILILQKPGARRVSRPIGGKQVLSRMSASNESESDDGVRF